MTFRLECLEKGGGAASSTAGSTVVPGETQRKPALIIGGWDPDQEAAATREAATDILRSVEAPIPDRWAVCARSPPRLCDSTHRRSCGGKLRTTPPASSKVRGANLHLGQRPDGTPRRVWIAMSQPPERRRRARLAAKVKRLYLTAGGDIGALQMEFSTGTAWVHNAKICSATAPPGGSRGGRARMGGHHSDRCSHQVHQRSDRCPLVPA